MMIIFNYQENCIEINFQQLFIILLFIEYNTIYSIIQTITSILF